MSALPSIRIARTDEELLRCFPALQQLRPHLKSDEFLARIRRQEQDGGYHIAFVDLNGAASCVAGYRVGENLAWGRFLYVDDLVTMESERSRGHGRLLFDWLLQQARQARCDEFHLDSGVQRFGAHRFYLARRMDITSHHFALKLK